MMAAKNLNRRASSNSIQEQANEQPGGQDPDDYGQKEENDQQHHEDMDEEDVLAISSNAEDEDNSEGIDQIIDSEEDQKLTGRTLDIDECRAIDESREIDSYESREVDCSIDLSAAINCRD